MDIREYLKNKKLLCDGAFGTYFAINSPQLMAEKANTENPQAVYDVHRAYIESGARLIRTNTFESNRAVLKCSAQEMKENISAAYAIAKKAAGDNVFVAGDIGPGNVEDYYIAADTFIENGADIIIFETFADIEPLREVLKHIKEKNSDIFVIVQFCVNQHGYTEEGISAARLMEKCDEIDEIDAMGFNCGIGPAHLLKIFEGLKTDTDKFVTALPNNGYPSVIQDRMVFLDNINYYASKMADISKYADIIGGCCGTTPGHIKAMAQGIDMDIPFVPHVPAHDSKQRTDGESNASNVFFSQKPEGAKIVAVELDPPKDGDCTRLMETANFLKKKNVDVITFADSPSGRTRADSILMSLKVYKEVGINVMPHICCRDKNAIGIGSMLLGAYINDIRNFLVITGDPVPSTSRDNVKGVFNLDSVRLMDYIREMNSSSFAKDKLSYGGAINYARRNLDIELKRALKKQEAGAEFFLTQPVYDESDIETLRDMKKKLSAKVLVGVMPLVSYTNALFIKNELTGITVPDWVVNRFSPDMSKEEARQKGIEIAEEVMKRVYDFADGFYFIIPFNRLEIAEQLFKLMDKLEQK